MEITANQDTRTEQQKLNEMVQNKVRSMIDRNHSTVTATFERMKREASIAQDFIAPIGKDNQFTTPQVTFKGEERVLMYLPDGEFNLHDNALGQLSERMGVPTRYMKGLAGGSDWERKLAANILNEHTFNTNRSRVLIRSVGEEVRAVLSDNYRRINSNLILMSFMEEVLRNGAVLSDAHMSDTKIWTEAILPTPIEVPTAKNGIITIYMGARLSTSDYGAGAVDMRSYLLNGACLNGMVRESVLRQVHLGGKLPDNLALSQQTYDYDTKTTVSAIRDLTHGLFTKDTFMQKAIEIQKASEVDVDFEKELKSLMGRGVLLKSEKEGVETLIMNNRYEDGVTGEATLWKLSQAITAHAREVEPSRAREMHEISGALLDRVNK